MNLNPIAFWHSLERLPLLFSLSVFALVTLLLVCFVALPLYLLLRNEPHNMRQWWRRRMDDEQTSVQNDAPRPATQRWLRFMQLTGDGLNSAFGFVTAYLVLFMALMQFTVVIMRYVFSYGSIQMQESIWYMHGLLFMLGAGYTLLHDAHVRLDVFYQHFTVHRKALVNLLGALLLLLPLCISTWVLSWSFVLHSWEVTEGSTETSGLPFIYLYKTVILLFTLLIGVQGLSLAARSVQTLLQTQK